MLRSVAQYCRVSADCQYDLCITYLTQPVSRVFAKRHDIDLPGVLLCEWDRCTMSIATGFSTERIAPNVWTPWSNMSHLVQLGNCGSGDDPFLWLYDRWRQSVKFKYFLYRIVPAFVCNFDPRTTCSNFRVEVFLHFRRMLGASCEPLAVFRPDGLPMAGRAGGCGHGFL